MYPRNPITEPETNRNPLIRPNPLHSLNLILKRLPQTITIIRAQLPPTKQPARQFLLVIAIPHLLAPALGPQIIQQAEHAELAPVPAAHPVEPVLGGRAHHQRHQQQREIQRGEEQK